ncbi:MAG: tRNA (guanine-N7-)-methyltransferase [Lysobacterales bacterium]
MSNSVHKNGNSRAVTTSQSGIHPQLEHYLKKHFETAWLQPLHPPSVLAFDEVSESLGAELIQRELIFDSGCGTGQSTRLLAARFPESLVFGVDRSMHRLQKIGSDHFPCREKNIIWLRAELETFWRLANSRSWKPAQHYLFYPNPYPKASQLKKRWHAHPVFPSLLALGGCLEMRCNWLVYALELAHAIEWSTGIKTSYELFEAEQPISAFERKYSLSEQQLFRVRAELPEQVRSVPQSPG